MQIILNTFPAFNTNTFATLTLCILDNLLNIIFKTGIFPKCIHTMKLQLHLSHITIFLETDCNHASTRYNDGMLNLISYFFMPEHETYER